MSRPILRRPGAISGRYGGMVFLEPKRRLAALGLPSIQPGGNSSGEPEATASGSLALRFRLGARSRESARR